MVFGFGKTIVEDFKHEETHSVSGLLPSDSEHRGAEHGEKLFDNLLLGVGNGCLFES